MPRRRGIANATGELLRRHAAGWRMSDRPLRVDPAQRIGAAIPGARRRGTSRQGRRPRNVHRPHRLFGRLLKFSILLLLWGAILGGGMIAYFALTLPDTSQLGIAQRRPTITILAEDGSTLANLGDLFGEPLTLKQMSPFLPQAVI